MNTGLKAEFFKEKIKRVKEKITYDKRKIKRLLRKIDAKQKRALTSAILILLIGVLVGNVMGHSLQTKKMKQQAAEYESEIEAVKSDKEKVQEQLTDLQQQLTKLQVDSTKKDAATRPWNLVLVNYSHEMEQGYVPELTELVSGYSVDSRIVEDARRMLEDAEKAGMNIIVCSAYRSVSYQEQLFNSSVVDRLHQDMNYWEAYQDTKMSVAVPGTSEHALGLALDLISNEYTELDEKQAQTKEAKWLEENCYHYGFILRYPPKKTEITGIIYEPWHYRYVGVEDAKKIMESGLTLEEYLGETH